MKDKKFASLVEPYLIAYDAGDAFSKRRHKTMSMSYDGDQSEDRQSEEVQSAYKRENEADEETEVRANFGLHHTEEQGEQNEETDWSWVLQDKDGDPLAESISSLQTTQEVLENEVQKLSGLVKDSEAEESTCGNDGQDVIVLPHGRVDVFEMNEKMQHLEQKLKEASDTIRQKDLRISNLEIAIDDAHRPLLEEDAANIVQLEMEVERQLQDKIQAEIQWLVMVKAKQNWQVRAEDRLGGAQVLGWGQHENDAQATGHGEQDRHAEGTGVQAGVARERALQDDGSPKDAEQNLQSVPVWPRTADNVVYSLKIFFAEVSVSFSDVVPT
ncbi:hypothetical protein PR202_gb15317 [Eleusine coracana subsp. coracana]|uniref:Uncharacterized protein n=1 Tax=Eleusine coracana subsp. coracana TaxID=191504 RepID=A0AAV5EXM7_ELECO|nr:hypothetical protein PR202_gb15317 [Eleusine coracana subsp. coracana]